MTAEESAREEILAAICNYQLTRQDVAAMAEVPVSVVNSWLSDPDAAGHYNPSQSALILIRFRLANFVKERKKPTP